MNKFTFLLILALALVACKEKDTDREPTIERSEINAVFDKKNPNEVVLNHFYMVLDRASFEDLRNSSFLNKSYAAIDAGMPDFHKVHDSSNVFYLRGKTHYIEILGPDNPFNEPVGQVGIGFSMAEDKHFPLSGTPELKEKKTNFLKGSNLAKYNLNNEEVDWYKAFYTFGMETNLSTWYAQYNPDFLKHFGEDESTTYSREKFLKNAYSPEKLFENITAITLDCNPADHFRIASELELLGCPLVNKPESEPIFKAGDIYVKLIRNENKVRSTILQVETSLNHDSNKTLQLGSIIIKNKEKRSLWIFNTK